MPLTAGEQAETTLVRAALAVDRIERAENVVGMAALERIPGELIEAIQGDMRIFICDEVLLLYLEERRLQRFPRYADQSVASILETVQQEIAEVGHDAAQLARRESLPEDHLYSIVSRVARATCLRFRRILLEMHPDIEANAMLRIVPEPDVANLFVPIASHLREIRTKVIRPDDAALQFEDWTLDSEEAYALEEA